MTTTEIEILSQSINDLPFTEGFKSFSKKIGVNTVLEIISIPVKKLMLSEGFTYHLLQELVEFLEKNNLTGMLNK